LALQSSLPFDIAGTPTGVPASLHVLPPQQGHWDELRDSGADPAGRRPATSSLPPLAPLAPLAPLGTLPPLSPLPPLSSSPPSPRGSGRLREPWQRFFSLLGDDGVAGLDQATASIARQVRDNDISYNVYADNGESRPWVLDPLPFLIDEAEWSIIERAVMQRAKLLNAIVADTYGEQTLLQRGLLPPAMVFGHPGYLRSVKGFVPRGGQYMQLVAIDMARAPGGTWTVLAHKTEAPSGLGYAVENRLIVSSVFTDPFRSMHVQRLAPFYSQLIATLVQGGRATMGDTEGSPRIALLTPGPYNETFFEHAFLARYLGVTLVEGRDLTVRDDKLFLKTFTGLERVHVLLRRLDDAFCDPVELRPDSTIGVPGLLQVMRAGNVMVSNVPGSGFVESPALHGFLPAISRALLGESLVLPSVPTWWCGEQAAREAALAALDSAFVIPTWPGVEVDGQQPGGFGDGAQKLAQWRARIEAMPDAFTIQAPFPGSNAPRYQPGVDGAPATIEGRPAVLRVYAIADVNGEWSVMPGGFTRLGKQHQAFVSMQFGGSSVDTWVLSSKSSSSFSLLPTPLKPDDLARKSRTVSSRAAENLFWAGRYGERAENNVRLLRILLSTLESEQTDDLFAMLVGLAELCGLVPGLTPFRTAHAQPTQRAFELTLVRHLDDGTRAASIGQNLASQTRANSDIRGRLSTDHWRMILAARNDFRDAIRTIAPTAGAVRYDRVRLNETLETLSTQLSAISGAQRDRMTRDEAWMLLYAGRHIERVWTMATFMRMAAESGQLNTPGGFDVLLQLFDCTLTYRSLYPGRYEVPALLDLLVVEPSNPRGLYGVYARLCKRLGEIAHAADGADKKPVHEGGMPFHAAHQLLAKLPGLEALCATTRDGIYQMLIFACDALCDQATNAANEISARYFSHAQAPTNGAV